MSLKDLALGLPDSSAVPIWAARRTIRCERELAADSSPKARVPACCDVPITRGDDRVQSDYSCHDFICIIGLESRQ